MKNPWTARKAKTDPTLFTIISLEKRTHYTVCSPKTRSNAHDRAEKIHRTLANYDRESIEENCATRKATDETTIDPFVELCERYVELGSGLDEGWVQQWSNCPDSSATKCIGYTKQFLLETRPVVRIIWRVRWLRYKDELSGFVMFKCGCINVSQSFCLGSKS
jgi:hypothetical protein